MDPTAQHLRRRADGLRDLAHRIDRLAVLDLHAHAADDTWRGSRPELCRALLATNRRQLHTAVLDLHAHAARLERRANELDAIARLAG